FAGLAAILLAPEAYWPVRRVGAEFHNAADGQQALAELNEDLAAAAAQHGPDPAGNTGAAGDTGSASAPAATGGKGWAAVPSVGLAGVHYAYPDRAEVLTDLTLATPAGPGLTALTGPSGRGTSTILDLLA